MTESPAVLGLPGSVRLADGPGGLKRLKVRDERFGKLDVFLHGAHVTRWVPKGQDPVLWLSRKSRFHADAAIRGGVPICFPWFGGGPEGDLKPAHGYARLRDWLVTSVVEREGGTEIDLSLENDAAGLAAMFRVLLGESLGLTLEVRNDGDAPVTYEEALHTYLAVSDVRQVGVEGLAGAEYLDQLVGPELVHQAEDVIRFAGETDRVYLGSEADVVVDDPGARRRIAVRKAGSASTIVWNPWTEKAAGMPDLDRWPSMLCIETANVKSDAITLAPGESHAMTATIEVMGRSSAH